MTIPSTGAVGLAAVQTEFGGSNPIALSEYYRGGNTGYVDSGITAGPDGIIAASGAIRLSTFRGTAKIVLVSPAFSSVYSTTASPGQTTYIYYNTVYIYPQWTTVGNNPSISYVTIEGDTSGAGGTPYHWGAQATGGTGTGGQFYDSTAEPATAAITTKTKNLYAWSSGATLLATGVLTYKLYPTPKIISVSASYNNSTNIVTVSYTTNGFVDTIGIYYNDDGSTIVSSTAATGTYTFTRNASHTNKLDIYASNTLPAGGSGTSTTGPTTVTMYGVIVANFYSGGNTGGSPPDTQYVLTIDFSSMGGPTGNFAYTITVDSGDAQVNSYTSAMGSYPTSQSGSGNFSFGGTTVAYANLAIPHGSGTITASVSKTGYPTWTKTLAYTADSSQSYSWVSQPTNINEGSAGTFQIQTSFQNVLMAYYIDLYGPDGGSRSTDFSSQGEVFNVNGSGLGTFTITPTADMLTEGVENFVVRVKYGQTSSGQLGYVRLVSNTITINDTSLTPTYNVTPAASSVNEGSSLTFNVSGTNIPNGTYYWAVNDITTSVLDFSSGYGGSFTISSNAGSFSVGIAADNSTEGSQTFTVSIKSGSSLSGTVLATSSVVTINDTSLTPTATANVYSPSYSYSGGEYMQTYGSKYWDHSISQGILTGYPGFPLIRNAALNNGYFSAQTVSVSGYGNVSVGYDGYTPYYYITNNNGVAEKILISANSYAMSHVYLYAYLYCNVTGLIYGPAAISPNMNTERYTHTNNHQVIITVPAKTTYGIRMRMTASPNGDYDYSSGFSGMANLTMSHYAWA